MQGALGFSKCPGGPEQLNQLAVAAAARRRTEDGEATEEVLPVGPIIADEGWFVEAEACRMVKPSPPARCTDPVREDYDPEHDSCFDLRTCLNKFPCAAVTGKKPDPNGYACYGLRKQILKELTDRTN